MTVDYISALNSRGSGLNTTQIVRSLVDAEIVPQRERLNQRLTKEETAITAVGALRSELDGLRKVLATPGAGQAFDAQSASPAIAIALSDPDAARPFDARIEVASLASAQVLAFGGFPGPLAVLPAGSLALAVAGNPQGATTVEITSPNTTLTDLARALDGLAGISASVVAVGDGTHSLVVKSAVGAAGAISITASADLAALEWTGQPGLAQMQVDGAAIDVARAEPSAAADAVLLMDGVEIRRAGNVITDLVPGARLELTAITPGPVRVQTIERADIALAEMQALVERLNLTRSALTEATRRGVMGAQPGPLAGDPVAERIARKLASITTEPLRGFGDRDYHLSEIGVRTRRDGLLEVDVSTFQAAYARSPDIYRAVFASVAQSDAAGVTVQTGAIRPPPGSHAFIRTSATSATLDGTSLIPRTLPAGTTGEEFYAVTGTFAGVKIRLEEGAAENARVYFGTSLLERIEGFIAEALTGSGDLTRRETRMQANVRTIEDSLARLDDKAASAEARYRERFVAMEQLVTQIKSSGAYMTALMDGWNKKD
jgi:flagellar hook-associated protein 2